jgi:hypothetical protein
MAHCAICLGNTKAPFTSKCQHTFCNKCILEWITQHDECPLCRNPISDTPTINNYDDEDEETNHEPIYIIDINEQTLSAEELDEVNYRIDDFIDTLGESLSVYKWKESNEGTGYTIIRKKTYYIDLKIELFSLRCLLTNLRNYYKINVGVHKRNFIEPKHRKKQFKLNKLRNASYLYK